MQPQNWLRDIILPIPFSILPFPPKRIENILVERIDGTATMSYQPHDGKAERCFHKGRRPRVASTTTTAAWPFKVGYLISVHYRAYMQLLTE